MSREGNNVTAMYVAVMPEHFMKGHPINEDMLTHIKETKCSTCMRFRDWHLNPKYVNNRKPKVPSCRTTIDSVTKYLNAQKRAQHRRTAIL